MITLRPTRQQGKPGYDEHEVMWEGQAPFLVWAFGTRLLPFLSWRNG